MRFGGSLALVSVAAPAHGEQVRSRTDLRYYGWFDWLRLALALLVLLSHEKLFSWEQAGNLGVQVFFALSGWLIGGILCQTERSGLKRFYFNRALRIWAPYYLTFTFLIAASLLHDHITSKWIEIVFYKLTFTYNLFGTPQLANSFTLFPLQATGNHFWSVNAEEQFYLLAPLLLVLLPRRIGRSVLLWTVLAITALIAHVYASIIFGVLAAVCAHRFGAFQESRLCRVLSLLTVLIGAAAIVAGFNYETAIPFCAIGTVLFLAVPRPPTRLGQFAGGISYPLYLNAWIAGIAMNAICHHFGVQNAPLQVCLNLASAIVLASLLYYFFDRRILSLRKRLYTPKRATLAVVAAYSAVTIGCSVGLALFFLHR